MNKIQLIIILIILTSFGIGIYFYQQLPSVMASHWDAKGEVNGYMSKFWGTFLMPLISILIFLLFILIPQIDPLKENIKKFKKYFDVFILLIMLFLFVLYLWTILWNVGYELNIIYFILPAIAVIFFYAGILIEHAKRNFFIGIRTPWTLSSDTVWDKTHKLGSKLFKATAIISLLGLIFIDWAFYILIFSSLVASLYTIIYSYFEFKKEKHYNT